MPGPAVLAVPGAMVAAKHLAYRAATSVDLTTAGSAAFAAFLVHWIWRKLPDWVKEDISFKNLLRNRRDMSGDELVGLFSVVGKIQSLANSIQNIHVEIPQLHAVLAFIQLSGQLKLKQVQQVMKVSTQEVEAREDSCSHDDTWAATRDGAYENAGESFPLTSLRSEELREALTMATWAYHDDSTTLTNRLLDNHYTMLRHHLNVRPGMVAHYIAVSPSKRQVVVGLRGTTSLEDILTDCCGNAVPLSDDGSRGDKVRVEVKAAFPNLVLADSHDEIVEIVSGHERIVCEENDDEGDNFVRCHEGILISARHVMEEIMPFLRDYLVECQYKVVFCGHSLGAGTAIVSAVLLRERYPELFLNDDFHKRIHVYAFAPPPVLDYDSAIAASSYCTSIVNNSDLVPRLSVSNLIVSMACLRKVQKKLVEHDLNPSCPASSVAFWNKISQGTNGEPLMSLSEYNTTVDEAHREIAFRKPGHLFVPGRVLLVYNPWSSENTIDDDTDGSSVNGKGEKDWRCVETTGSSSVFQSLEVDGLRCFTDHLTSSYYEAMGMEYKF
jgi:Lipase (class 3)